MYMYILLYRVYHWNCWIISPSAPWIIRLAAPPLHAQLLRLCQELSKEVRLVEGLRWMSWDEVSDGIRWQYTCVMLCYVVKMLCCGVKRVDHDIWRMYYHDIRLY